MKKICLLLGFVIVGVVLTLFVNYLATIANTASLLVYYGWSGFGFRDSLWSAIMILIAALVGAEVLWKRVNAAYAAVDVWAVFAITVRYANETPITFAA